MTPPNAKMRKSNLSFSSFLTLYCLFITFASINKQITVASHNLHGFKKSSSFHKKCLEKYGGIWLAQETWLPESKLSQMCQLGVQFVAHSGMEDSITGGIMRGRPYGGVSIAWSSDLDHVVKPLVNYRHKRIVCVEAYAEPHPLLFVSVYMPYFDAGRRQECMDETIETISMLDEILADHPLHKVIIGGDFNTEMNDSSPFALLWAEFLARFDLVCCDQFYNNNNNNNNNNSNNYTYFHESLNHKKWLDHFIVSSSLAPLTQNHEIIDAGDNTSDHLPIKLEISCSMKDEPAESESIEITPSLKWEKCTEQHKQSYSDCLNNLLQHNPGVNTLCCDVHCKNQICRLSIQNEFNSLTRVITQADKVLPRHKPGVQKHWWNPELTQLRNQSIDIHRLWQMEGKPHSGRTNDERCRVRAAYKKAIRSAQNRPKQTYWDKMHNCFLSKGTTQFWKSWKQLYNKGQSDLHTVVNGVTSKKEIANSFKTHFTDVSKPNSQSRVDELKSAFDEKYREATSNHINCSCSSYRVSVDDVIDATFSMQKGKCSDDSLIHAEHFFNAPLRLFERLQCLFNSMLMHEFVPTQFQRGTIVPIVKDNKGDKGDLNNYRGITIAPIISKIFEHSMRIIFKPFLSTSIYQFGFKRESSTSLAVHCLKETINYYTSNGSNTYCSFLDASKAFDRLVHAGLFLKLLQRQVPLIFLNIIMMWYSDLQCRVRWGDTISDWFDVKAGVRQGGILSPDFYCVYVDDLVEILSAIGIGCYLKNVFLSLLLYADDMALLAPSLKGLQTLLTATESYCKQWDILLNAKKTKNMSFGKMYNLPQLVLDDKPIEWDHSWTYLGITLESHKEFNCNIDRKVKSFYRSANAILRIEGRSNEMVMLQLLESKCVSILTYGIDVIHIANRDERRRLRVAYNSIFRKVFGFRQWESVTELQHSLKRPTWEELIAKRCANFEMCLAQCPLFNQP